MANLDTTIIDLINQSVRSSQVHPLILGGIPSTGGGLGGPPGGFVGYLPQFRVAGDYTELAIGDDLPASGATLLDNLNRIRYNIDQLETTAIDMEATLSGINNDIDYLLASGGTAVDVSYDDVVVVSGVTRIDFSGPSVEVTSPGGSVVNVNVTASGSGGGNTYIYNYYGSSGAISYIDQSGGTDDTYGVLQGDLDGVNADFITSSGYISGNLLIYLNGQLLTQGSSEDWIETIPESGMFSFNSAPLETDNITAVYFVTSSGGGGGGGGGASDASDLTYTPAVLTDWNGDADPGGADDALDQLAARADDLEGRVDDLEGASAFIEDAAYGAGWDGDTTHAPSQNAVYDKLVSIGNEITGLAPWRVTIFPVIEKPNASAGTWAAAYWNGENLNSPILKSNVSTVYVAGMQNSSSAQNDYVQYELPLSAGTWSIYVWVRKSTNTGIITVSIGGSSLGTLDTYAASVAYTEMSITGFSIATGGILSLRLEVTSKNASSSSYNVGLFSIHLVRTA